jgi:hypothetical protein
VGPDHFLISGLVCILFSFLFFCFCQGQDIEMLQHNAKRAMKDYKGRQPDLNPVPELELEDPDPSGPMPDLPRWQNIDPDWSDPWKHQYPGYPNGSIPYDHTKLTEKRRGKRGSLATQSEATMSKTGFGGPPHKLEVMSLSKGGGDSGMPTQAEMVSGYIYFRAD